MLPPDLDDWLTDEWQRVAEKSSTQGRDRLDERERLLNEVALFDTEQRNGGVSQYFCNWDMDRWHILSRLAPRHLPTFSRFARGVDAVVGDSADPYTAVMDSETDLDAWYEKHQIELVTELRAFWNVPVFSDLEDEANPHNGQFLQDRDAAEVLLRERSLTGPSAFWLEFGDGRTLTVAVYPPLACVQFTDAKAVSHVALPSRSTYRDGHFEVSVGGTATPLERRLFMPIAEAEALIIYFVEVGRMSPAASWEAV